MYFEEEFSGARVSSTNRPYPQEKQESNTAMDLDEDNIAPCGCPAKTGTPEWILSYYSSSTFNICPHVKSQGMTGPPVKFAIKPDADLVCHTKPFKVPLHSLVYYQPNNTVRRLVGK